jgi:glutaredoxin 3
MKPVRMYTTRSCPFCVMARRLLSARGAQPEEIYVDTDPARRQEMMERTGRRTVPQIFIDGQHVGGYEEIAQLEHRGQLAPLLGPPGGGGR